MSAKETCRGAFGSVPTENFRDRIILEPFEGAQRYRRVETCKKGAVMRGVLLWLVGIPIPVIILFYVFKAM
jgi:hypothetical protein